MGSQQDFCCSTKLMDIWYQCLGPTQVSHLYIFILFVRIFVQKVLFISTFYKKALQSQKYKDVYLCTMLFGCPMVQSEER